MEECRNCSPRTTSFYVERDRDTRKSNSTGRVTVAGAEFGIDADFEVCDAGRML